MTSYTREKENFVYSIKAYIPDFVFKKIDLVVEVKLCDSLQRVKEMVSAEINDDIVAYKTSMQIFDL